MEIDLREVRIVVNKLLDHIIETRRVTQLGVEHPNYWNVRYEQLIDPTGPPDNLDIGSLTDDWDLLRSLIESDTPPVAYQLTEVAPLIRYIGEVLGRELASQGG